MPERTLPYGSPATPSSTDNQAFDAYRVFGALDSSSPSPEGADCCLPRLVPAENLMAERERATRTSALLDELAAVLRRLVVESGSYSTSIPGVTVTVRDHLNESSCAVYDRAIGLMVSGRKCSVIGNRRYEYGRGDILITTIDMPALWQVLEATEAQPFMAVTVRLSEEILRDLTSSVELTSNSAGDASKEHADALTEVNVNTDPARVAAASLTVTPPEMVDAYLRLVKLLEAPEEERREIAPLLIREIHYRALKSASGPALVQLFSRDSRANRISRAVDWLRENFREPLSVTELADKVHMAPSTFHRHFKAVTSLSPLQYHKRLRLHEARRLMMVEHADAATAGYAVGYVSPTQFSREYKRLFGAPPKRSLEQRPE